jgi:hypothetical protein
MEWQDVNMSATEWAQEAFEANQPQREIPSYLTLATYGHYLGQEDGAGAELWTLDGATYLATEQTSAIHGTRYTVQER